MRQAEHFSTLHFRNESFIAKINNFKYTSTFKSVKVKKRFSLKPLNILRNFLSQLLISRFCLCIALYDFNCHIILKPTEVHSMTGVY